MSTFFVRTRKYGSNDSFTLYSDFDDSRRNSGTPFSGELLLGISSVKILYRPLSVISLLSLDLRRIRVEKSPDLTR